MEIEKDFGDFIVFNKSKTLSVFINEDSLHERFYKEYEDDLKHERFYGEFDNWVMDNDACVTYLKELMKDN